MWKFLITEIVATVTLASPSPGVSLMKALSSADFTRPPSPVRVGGGGARLGGEPPPSVPAPAGMIKAASLTATSRATTLCRTETSRQ